MSDNNSHLPCFGQAEFSPMTEISINLSGTKISHLHTRKRRLSLTSEKSESLDQYEFTNDNSVENVPYSAKTVTASTVGRKGLKDITNQAYSSESPLRAGKMISLAKKRCTNLIDSPSRHDVEISFYGSGTPHGSPENSPELPKKISRLKTSRRGGFDDFDHVSRDSGLGSFQDRLNETKSVQFLEPCSLPDGEPSKFIRTSLFRGLSEQDDFLQDLEVETLEDNDDHLPKDFSNLVSGSILSHVTTNESTPKCGPYIIPTLSAREYRTPASSRVRNRLFSTSSPSSTVVRQEQENENSELDSTLPAHTFEPNTDGHHPLKRSQSLFDSTDKIQAKRYKNMQGAANNLLLLEPLSKEALYSTPKPVFRRSVSTCSPNAIMTAVQRSALEPDLIGDCSRPHVLPLVPGRHQDLKSISAATLAKLINGDYNDIVASYKVIDCRYPYEFEGGHIRGAFNYFTKEQIETELFNIKRENPITQKPTMDVQTNLRDIVIFHCEFSHQRGPKLFRFLRTIDRQFNDDKYPALHYPEIYLLEGGYKRFFEGFSPLCEPVAYKRMDDPAHEEECRLFRAQKRGSSAAASRKLMSKRSALEF